MSAAGEILAYSKRVNAALRACPRHYEAADDATPYHNLIAKEDQTLDEWGTIRETAVRLFLWLAAQGPHTGNILMRIYALGDHMMIAPYCKLSRAQKEQMFSASREAQLWRLQRIAGRKGHLAFEKRINAALRAFVIRTKFEPATDEPPLHLLLSAESLAEWGAMRETVVCILLWLAAEGSRDGDILKRLFIMGDHMMIEPFCLLNLREKARLLNDSHGAQLWRLRRIAVDPLMRKGCRSYKASGQKGLLASEAAASAQQGNSNRRGTSRKTRNEHVLVAQKSKPKKQNESQKHRH